METMSFPGPQAQPQHPMPPQHRPFIPTLSASCYLQGVMTIYFLQAGPYKPPLASGTFTSLHPETEYVLTAQTLGDTTDDCQKLKAPFQPFRPKPQSTNGNATSYSKNAGELLRFTTDKAGNYYFKNEYPFNLYTTNVYGRALTLTMPAAEDETYRRKREEAADDKPAEYPSADAEPPFIKCCTIGAAANVPLSYPKQEPAQPPAENE